MKEPKASAPKPKSLVEELRSMGKIKPEKPAGKKRFNWSAPIVSPQENKNHSFGAVAGEAPRPRETGTMMAAAHDLRSARADIYRARKAKKARY